jgi:hypothetical protein
MTVYPSVDHADFFASHKWPLPELNPAIDAELAAELAAQRQRKEAWSALPLMVKDSFRLLDDLQRITHDGCALDDADIGAIQAKLILLRICLNIQNGVDTEQITQRQDGPGVAESLG